MSDAIVPVDLTALAAQQRGLEASVLQLEPVRCETAEDRLVLGQWLARVQTVLKALEDEREVLVRPLLDDKKRVDALYKPVTRAAEGLKALVKGKIGEYELRLVAAQEAARALAASTALAGDYTAAQDALAAIPEATAAGTGASTSFVWVTQVVNVPELPREYLVADWAALNALGVMASLGGGPAPVVPGVIWRREARVAVRGRKS